MSCVVTVSSESSAPRGHSSRGSSIGIESDALSRKRSFHWDHCLPSKFASAARRPQLNTDGYHKLFSCPPFIILLSPVEPCDHSLGPHANLGTLLMLWALVVTGPPQKLRTDFWPTGTSIATIRAPIWQSQLPVHSSELHVTISESFVIIVGPRPRPDPFLIVGPLWRRPEPSALSSNCGSPVVT